MELKIDEYLVELIQEATFKAVEKLFNNYEEDFYYCSLITSGEGLCPILSAWSYQALDKVASEEEDIEEAKYYLKWSYEETPYFAFGEEYYEKVKHEFSDRMKRICTEQEYNSEIQIRINSMEQVMHNLDEMGIFGTGNKRLGIVINAEFMPPDYTNTERAIRLNPREALVSWLEEASEE